MAATQTPEVTDVTTLPNPNNSCQSVNFTAFGLSEETLHLWPQTQNTLEGEHQEFNQHWAVTTSDSSSNKKVEKTRT